MCVWGEDAVYFNGLNSCGARNKNYYSRFTTMTAECVLQDCVFFLLVDHTFRSCVTYTIILSISSLTKVPHEMLAMEDIQDPA